jgi:hypothetical protein
VTYEPQWGSDVFGMYQSLVEGRDVAARALPCTIQDAGAYGLITVQGHGTIDKHPVETPALIRFGQLTYDEYFVSAGAAARGVTLHNPSQSDPLVMLKHFGPNHAAPAA